FAAAARSSSPSDAPNPRPTAGSVGHEAAEPGIGQQPLRHAAEKPFAQPRMPVATGDDEIGAEAGGGLRHHRRDVALTWTHLAARPDAVPREPGNEVGEARLLRDPIVLADGDDRDLARGLEEWQGVGDGPARLTPVLPPYDDALRLDLRDPGPGDEDGPPRGEDHLAGIEGALAGCALVEV